MSKLITSLLSCVIANYTFSEDISRVQQCLSADPLSKFTFFVRSINLVFVWRRDFVLVREKAGDAQFL